jgi:hypothetical protein
MNDKDAIAQAQERYAGFCLLLGKKAHETSGEIAFLDGRKLVALIDARGKLAAGFRVSGEKLVNLDRPELIKLRTRLSGRKVR